MSTWTRIPERPSLRGLFVAVLGLASIATAAADDLASCRAQAPTSVPACQRLAQAGNSDGLFGLGMLYLEGVGVGRDFDKSFQLMMRSAQLGNKYAQLQVGQAYVNGQGVARDYEEGLAWFMVAKENGNDVAQRGIDFLTKSGAVRNDRLAAVARRATQLRSASRSEAGFAFDPSKGSVQAADLKQFCSMVLPSVDSVVQLKRYGRPRSDAHQLTVGMTDPPAIRMINGVIDWVWRVDVPAERMRDTFYTRCLRQSPDVGFLFRE